MAKTEAIAKALVKAEGDVVKYSTASDEAAADLRKIVRGQLDSGKLDVNKGDAAQGQVLRTSTYAQGAAERAAELKVELRQAVAAEIAARVAALQQRRAKSEVEVRSRRVEIAERAGEIVGVILNTNFMVRSGPADRTFEVVFNAVLPALTPWRWDSLRKNEGSGESEPLFGEKRGLQRIAEQAADKTRKSHGDVMLSVRDVDVELDALGYPPRTLESVEALAEERAAAIDGKVQEIYEAAQQKGGAKVEGKNDGG